MAFQRTPPHKPKPGLEGTFAFKALLIQLFLEPHPTTMGELVIIIFSVDAGQHTFWRLYGWLVHVLFFS
jgi:hypothetical protein